MSEAKARGTQCKMRKNGGKNEQMNGWKNEQMYKKRKKKMEAEKTTRKGFYELPTCLDLKKIKKKPDKKEIHK